MPIFVLALLAVLAALPVAGLVPSPVAAEAAAAVPAGGRTVVVGIPGLRWSDVSVNDTPALWQLTDDGALANLSVRTVRPASCPADGWLTLNSGARSTMRRSGGHCVPLPQPVREARGGWAVPGWAIPGWAVPGWTDIVRYNRQYSYDPRFGLLARGAAQRGCATAVGPGGALALADEGGRLPRYVPTVAQADLAACPLTVVDLGAIRELHAPERTTAVRQLDGELSRMLARLPADATLFIAGLADTELDHTHLSVMLASGGTYEKSWLVTRSTRQVGFTQLTDLTPTVLAAIGVETPPGAVGAVMRDGRDRPEVPDAVRQLAGRDRGAQAVREAFNPFFAILILGQIAAYVLLALARRLDRAHTRRWLPAIEVVALVFAAAPAAAFLTNLVQWWRADRPGLVLWISLTVWSAFLGGSAFATAFPPRVIGPAGSLAAGTAGLLAADVVLGSRLQLSSLYGLSPLTAGRFYGFGNIAFAVFAMTVLIGAAWVAAWLLVWRKRRAATLAVALIGVAAVVVDGWPAFGADFGGVLALVPGFALLTLGVSGMAVTAWRVAAAAAAAVATVATIAVLDWTRPAAERSHLGRFVQQILDGDAGAVLIRKIDANLGSLSQRPLLAVFVPVAFVIFALIVARPERFRVRALAQAYKEVPVLKPAFAACLVTAAIGFAVNDSGIIVPAVALAVAAPLGIAMCAEAASLQRPPRPAARPRPPEPGHHARHAARGSAGRPAGR